MQSIVTFLHSPLMAVIGIVLFGALLIATGVMWEHIAKRKNLFQNLEDKGSARDRLDNLIDKISFIRKGEERLDQRLLVLRVRYKARDITDIRLICVLAAIILGIVLSNMLLVFPLIILAWTVPYSIVERRIQKRIELFETQLLSGMQGFLVEFATLRNAQQAFVRVAEKVEYPLRHEFEYVARRLNSGEYPEQIMQDFAARTQNKWAMLFSRLMIFHFKEGANVEGQILQITQQMSGDQIMRDKNRTEVSAIRNTNLVLNALIPLVYISDRVMNPDAAAVYTTTATGKLILVGVAFVALSSLWLGKRLTKM